jgi:hypothetical protein
MHTIGKIKNTSRFNIIYSQIKHGKNAVQNYL